MRCSWECQDLRKDSRRRYLGHQMASKWRREKEPSLSSLPLPSQEEKAKLRSRENSRVLPPCTYPELIPISSDSACTSPAQGSHTAYHERCLAETQHQEMLFWEDSIST
jgi:hypothetical protein